MDIFPLMDGHLWEKKVTCQDVKKDLGAWSLIRESFFSDSQIFLGDQEKTWLNRHCKLMYITYTIWCHQVINYVKIVKNLPSIFCYTAARCNSSIDSLSNHWALRLNSQISKPSNQLIPIWRKWQKWNGVWGESTKKTSWWFQPIWKIWVKVDIFTNFRGENKNIWNL